MHVANSTFPVMHALGQDCGQQQVYQRCVMPLLMLFLEGFDASVLTYGHTKTGKSYTLFGDGFGPKCAADEDEAKHEADDNPEEVLVVDTDSEGVILRSVRDIFMNLTTHLSNRNFIIHVGWIAVGAADEVVDLLSHGIVQCQNYNELLELLQRGWRNLTRSSPSGDTHNMFTLTLEQQWVNPGDGRLQHRLSTISFCDLAAAERVVVRNNLINRDMVLHKNNGLQALDNVISCLSMVQQQPQSQRRNSDLSAIPYNQTVLSTLLKDSFGGRAQTIVIVCVSAQEEHVEETLLDLQFALKVQCVRNFITMNAFVDNNTSIPGDGGGGVGVAEVVPDVIPIDVAATQGSSVADLIGATSYLQKLVANAEQVLIKLMRSSSLTQEERGDVEEWLYMKAECEDCLSSVDMNNMNNSRSQQAQHNLGPIHEQLGEEDEDEDMEGLTRVGGSGVGGMVHRHHHLTTTTTDSESEYQRADLDDKIENLMDELRLKTDALVEQRYNEYLRTHPKPIFESVENLRPLQEAASIVPDKSQPATVVQPENSVATPVRNGGGRRKSIQPGATLSSLELEMLNRVSAARQGINGKDQLLPLDAEGVEMALCLPQKSSKATAGDAPLGRSITLKRWQKIATDVEATVRQIRELEHTIGLKQKLIAELHKSNDTRVTARARFQKKRGKLEAEYEKVKRQLAKAVASGSGRTRSAEVDRLKAMTGELEKRLQDLASIKHIATDSGQNLKKLEASLVDSRRECEVLQKTLKKERRLKEALEQELDKGAAGATTTTTAAAMKGDQLVAKDASTAIVQKTTSNKNLKVVNDRLSHLDQVLREKSEHMERYQDGEKRESLRHEIRNLRRTRDHLLEQRCELARKLKREKVLTNTEERKLLECDEAIEAIDAAIEFKNELICGRRSVDTSVSGGPESVREQGEQMLMARLNKLSEEEMRTLLYKYFMKVIDLREAGRKLEIQLLSLERDRDTWEWRERMLSHAVRQARLEGERNAVLMQREHETKLTLMLRHLANETGSSGASSHDATTTAVMGPGGHEMQIYKDQGRGGGRLDLLSNRYKQQQQQQQLMDGRRDRSQHQQTTTTTTNNKLFAKFQVLTQYSNEKRSIGGALIPTHNLRQLQPTSVPPVAKVTREKNKLIIQQCQERRGHHQQQQQQWQDEEQMSDSDVSNGNTLQMHPALHFRK